MKFSLLGIEILLFCPQIGCILTDVQGVYTEDYIEGQRSKKKFIHKFNFRFKASTDLDRIIVEGRAFHFLMVHGK